MSQKVFLTFDEAVSEFKLPADQLQAWVSQKRLPTYHFHNTLSFKRDDLARLKGEDSGDAPAPDPGRINELLMRMPEEGDEKTGLLPLDPLSGAAEDEDTEIDPHLLVAGKKDEAETRSGGPEKEQPSSVVRFHCGCGKHLRAERKFIGQKITCPRCKSVLEVPEKGDPPRPARRPRSPAPRPEVVEGHHGATEGPAPGGQHPRGDESADGIPLRLRQIEQAVESLQTELAAIRKHIEQTRFDIARLYDLIGRLKPNVSTGVHRPATVAQSAEPPEGLRPPSAG
ncbi:MAG: hypothetical protein HYU36_20990 [Planctomycetes bacterium]|nr:hypothetical protein [Planctomycetota bacterium]